MQLILEELLHHNSHLLLELVQHQHRPLHHEGHHQVALRAQDQNLLVSQQEILEHRRHLDDLNQFLNLNHVNQQEHNKPEYNQPELNHQELSQQDHLLPCHLKLLNLRDQELSNDNQYESSQDQSFHLNNFLLSKIVDQLSNSNQLPFEVYLNKLRLDFSPPLPFNPLLQSLKEAFKANLM